MIYKCISNLHRGYTIYEEGTLWESFSPIREGIILVNVNTGECIQCSELELKTHFTRL
jgi:hypothetical protein